MNTNHEIAIETRNLCKKYGDLEAVQNLSIQIQKGEVFGFLGPNGAGKTTSINMLCGLLKPTEGEIFISGKKLTRSNNHELRALIGLCPQQNIIWPKLTCIEQLVFMGEMHDFKRKDALKRGIWLLDTLGLAEKRNKLAHTLSGGMKRRLNICLALIHDPEIAVFDEPEAGLDPQSRILVRDFIRNTASEKTVILTTHNMDEADRMAHRVAIIDNGKLLLINTPDNLKKTVGEGDILEIFLSTKNADEIEIAKNKLSQIADKISIVDNCLILKSKNLVEKIPEITIILKNSDIKIGELKLRENTLEDVFIHLTGRSLRQ